MVVMPLKIAKLETILQLLEVFIQTTIRALVSERSTVTSEKYIVVAFSIDTYNLVRFFFVCTHDKRVWTRDVAGKTWYRQPLSLFEALESHIVLCLTTWNCELNNSTKGARVIIDRTAHGVATAPSR